MRARRMDARFYQGMLVPKPDGAFYLFPKVKGAGDSFEFCKRL
jgi:aspartate/methionine/tyrosine aminotransferase